MPKILLHNAFQNHFETTAVHFSPNTHTCQLSVRIWKGNDAVRESCITTRPFQSQHIPVLFEPVSVTTPLWADALRSGMHLLGSLEAFNTFQLYRPLSTDVASQTLITYYESATCLCVRISLNLVLIREGHWFSIFRYYMKLWKSLSINRRIPFGCDK